MTHLDYRVLITIKAAPAILVSACLVLAGCATTASSERSNVAAAEAEADESEAGSWIWWVVGGLAIAAASMGGGEQHDVRMGNTTIDDNSSVCVTTICATGP